MENETLEVSKKKSTVEDVREWITGWMPGDKTATVGKKRIKSTSKTKKKKYNSLGEYNNEKNAPSEIHYGLHGDGNVLKDYSEKHTVY